MSPRRAAVAALVGYTVFFVLFFSPVLMTGRVLAPFDGFRFHYPHFALAPALWDPNLSTGFPAAADPQVMTWYPPALLRTVVPFSYNAIIIAAYVFASWFTFLYVRTLTRDAMSALVAGLVFGASGFMLANLDHPSMLHAAMWLPAMLLAIGRLADTTDARWRIGLSLSVACCITAGHVQIAFYALAAAAAYAWAIRNTAERPIRFLGIAAAAFSAGVLLTAVQLVPTLELARLSTRSAMGYDEFVSYSLRPQQLITWLFPYLFGGMGGRLYPGPYFGPLEPHPSMAYVGSGALVLAGIALLVRWRETIVRFYAALGALGLLLALGGATPVARVTFLIPIVNSFRAQGRFVFLIDMAIAVLAGLGADAVRRGVRPWPWLRSAALAGPALLALGAGAVWLVAPSLRAHAADVGFPVGVLSPLADNAVRVPLAAACLVAAALTAVAARPRATVAAAALCAAIGIELTSFGLFETWRYESPTPAALSMPAELDAMRARLTHDGERWLAAAGVLGSALPPDISSLWNVPSVSKFGPLLPRRYSDVVGMQPYGGVEGAWGAYDNRALDLAGVRYAAFPTGQQFPDGAAGPEFQAYASNVADARRWRIVTTTATVVIAENARTLPRARLVTRSATLTPAEILAAIHTSRLPNGSVFDPETTALVEEPVALSDARPAESGAGQARLIESVGSRVTIETDTPATALLVLADLYYPGWTATVDDRPARVLVANYDQRAVVVAAGRHRVRFVYRPMSLYVGAGISLLALAGLGAMATRRAPADGAERTSKQQRS
jgi:hypothetical protein